MWLLVAFDLPTKTKAERRRYTQFRNILLEENFIQVQYSLYMRHFPTIETACSKARSIGSQTPDRGKTSCYLITDKQHGMTLNFYGKYPAESATKDPAQQILLFSDEMLDQS